MGFRYQKRIKIVPGVKVNMSKNGISSITLGRRGAVVNINKNGSKVTTGVPGTGMSYSTNRSNKMSSNGKQTVNQLASNPIRIEQILNEKEHCLNMLDIAGIMFDNSLRKNAVLKSKKQKQILALNDLVLEMTKQKNTNIQMKIQVEQILKKYNLIRFAKSIAFEPSTLSLYQATLIVYIEANNHLPREVRKSYIKDTLEILVD